MARQHPINFERPVTICSLTSTPSTTPVLGLSAYIFAPVFPNILRWVGIPYEDKRSVSQECKGYLELMRGWPNPWGGNRIRSLLGTATRSVRIPNHFAGPFESEKEFNEYLIRFSWSGGFSSEIAYNDALNRAKRMENCLIKLCLPTVTSNTITSW